MVRLIINGQDTARQYGVYLDTAGLAALMTPSGLKDYVTNDSALAHGISLGGSPKMKERTISLTLYLKASSNLQFLQRYAALCEIFQAGQIDISTSFQQGVVYHCWYQSCSQFSQFNGRLAKFALKLIEPNPNNRI